MNTRFVKPKIASIRFPTIIDKFSRTLATPISSLKSSLSVSARIGANYHENAKFLQIDARYKCIRFLKQKKSNIDFKANAELLVDPANTDEELIYI